MDEVSIVKQEVRSMEWAKKIREKMIEQILVPICTTSPANQTSS